MKILENAFSNDLEFKGTNQGVGGKIKIVDGWPYQAREFPAIVLSNSSAKNRRMGFDDFAETTYQTKLIDSKEDNDSPTTRIFRVNSTLFPGDKIRISNPTTDPINFDTLVEDGVGSDLGFRVVTITGNAVGPEELYPIKMFNSEANRSTGEKFAGWYDMSAELQCVGRNTVEREKLVDKVLAFLWFTRKNELKINGVILTDVSFVGEGEEKFGTDQLYKSTVRVDASTEWAEIRWFDGLVESIDAVPVVLTP